MTNRIRLAAILAAVTAASWSGAVQGVGQAPQGPPPQGAPMRMGGPGTQTERKVVAQFDKDGNGRLNAAERREARTWLESQPQTGPGRGRMGGRGGAVATGSPGERVTAAGVKKYGNEPLYDPNVLRTFFFEFENDDWEKELEVFSNTDVEVPATLTVDGRAYREVGVHFRGMSSFFTVPAGLKRSINVSVDWVHEQSIGGYRTLNLLNSHVDPTYTRTALYMEAARDDIPAPKVNHARVVLNGESWGIYVNAQQFNKDLINEWFKTEEGARWKVPGSPGGRGGLEYLGDDPEPYKRVYEIKSKDNQKSWAALVQLTKVLNTTPPDQLEKALGPILDIDATLKFLALDVTLVNGDGYWTRASDYSIYLDTKGRFHVIPHDANETMGPGGGRGMGGRMGPPPGAAGAPPPPPPPPGTMIGPAGAGGPQRMGGPGGGGPELDPLVGLNDATKPLRSKLLAVPALRERYLGYVRQIATKWLDWRTLEPRVRALQAVIAEDVKKDTRKLDTFEAFQNGIETMKTFVERRRTYLLNYK